MGAARRQRRLRRCLTRTGFEVLNHTRPENKKAPRGAISFSGGEGGIRTHGTEDRTLDFESSPFDHSGTSPDFFISF